MKAATTKQSGPQVNYNWGPKSAFDGGGGQTKKKANNGATNCCDGFHAEHEWVRGQVSRVRQGVFFP